MKISPIILIISFIALFLFFGSESNLRSHIVFNFCDFSVSFSLENFPSLKYVHIFESVSHLFCTMSLTLGLSSVFSWLKCASLAGSHWCSGMFLVRHPRCWFFSVTSFAPKHCTMLIKKNKTRRVTSITKDNFREENSFFHRFIHHTQEFYNLQSTLFVLFWRTNVLVLALFQ